MEDNRVAKYYIDNPDIPIEEMAVNLHMTISGMYKILQRTGTAPNRAKQYNVSAEELVASRGDKTVSELAEHYGMSASTVYRIYKNANIPTR